MAEKRMFTNKIISSDAFSGMTLAAQALYVHLNMNADDDGIVDSPHRIRKAIGAPDEALAELIEKRFILVIDGVTIIKHWRMNNNIREERKAKTAYPEILEQLKIKENGAYTLARKVDNQTATDCQTNVRQLTGKCQANVRQMSDNRQANGGKMPAQYSIDKNSIDIDRENAHAREETDREILERTFREFWDEYPKKQNESAACRAWISLAPSPELAAEIIKAVKENKKRNAEWKRNGGRYIPKAENWLFDQRWRDEISEEKDEEADKGKAAGDDYYNDEFFEKFVERKRAERKKREEELKNGTSTNEGNVGRAE